MKYLLISLLLLLLNSYLPISYCKEIYEKRTNFVTFYTHLTTNYTIDFFRNNIKTQKCYSNEECPHYSNGCYISASMFKSKGITSNGYYDSKTLNVSKEYLIKNNIYGICHYRYYCTENKDKTIPNDNCIVLENTNKDEPSFYLYEGFTHQYNLKTNFSKNNITKVNHCNADSIENKYCDGFYDVHCEKNNDCFSNNCNSNNHCLDSKDFNIYLCTNDFGINGTTYDISGNSDEIKVNAGCKKIDNEYCNDSSECESNYSVDGYCLSKTNYEIVHRYDKSNRINIIIVIIIIILIIIMIILFFCCIKKMCFHKK